MEIAANRQLGQLVFTTMCDRASEKGHDVPHAAIPNLGEYLQRVGREIALTVLSVQAKVDPIEKIMEETRPPAWALNLARLDPVFNIHVQTFMAMSFTSHLGEDFAVAGQVFIAANNFFQRKGLRPFSDEERTELTARAVELAARQQAPGTLGAAGEALFFTTMSHLQALAAGSKPAQKVRRRKFRQSLQALCLEVENERLLAERKARASLIGEMLEQELRASGSNRRAEKMTSFWDEFRLFFDVQSLPQYYMGQTGEPSA